MLYICGMKRDFLSSILAGICISLGGFVNLVVGGVAGAVLFSFGLLTVVHYGFRLYTGYIGFMEIRKDFNRSLLILGGNVLGCLLVALLARVSPFGLCEKASALALGRLSTGSLQCGALAIGCGFIVTAAVKYGREGKWLPLLFGVPCFILCGFPHCIADAFYYLCVPFNFWGARLVSILATWFCIVAGNFIGCNLCRWILKD